MNKPTQSQSNPQRSTPPPTTNTIREILRYFHLNALDLTGTTFDNVIQEAEEAINNLLISELEELLNPELIWIEPLSKSRNIAAERVERRIQALKGDTR